MKLLTALGPLTPLKDALKYAFRPFINEVWIQILDRLHFRSPSELRRWELSSIRELKRTFFAHLWRAFGPGSDQNSQQLKRELLSPAQGLVLDVGAGLGHSTQYLSREKVSRYIAVEPNFHMHAVLREAANKAGYFEADGSFVLLSCPAEDMQTILEASRLTESDEGAVDSIVFILTLCSIPQAEKIATRLVRDVLRPGGTLFIFEHVRHRRADVAWWQWLWSPLWSVFFDGCRLDCATDRWLEEMKDIDGSGREMGMWKEKTIQADAEEEHILTHVHGTFVKHD
ncbi:S-adenosyl-L-methionine-dependent methyltransferase [Rhodocollybia butyracea]|uniref:S-adenosyl-L-methionine-dependent methyltransferase n=1 Tax=Rhodocollybia butyracea TaxID=206335 RepID=A0A9P5QAV6_9AGAR|nr:S-adenosyl-L-methionine-dependent methyltransferase [Rhodocollybia butyracea]